MIHEIVSNGFVRPNLSYYDIFYGTCEIVILWKCRVFRTYFYLALTEGIRDTSEKNKVWIPFNIGCECCTFYKNYGNKNLTLKKISSNITKRGVT